MTSGYRKSFEKSIAVILVKRLSLYDLPVKSKKFPHIKNECGHWPNGGPPIDLGAELFFGKCIIIMKHPSEETV